MALLISCWFIIESIIIPDGFLKWFYLSFYIHPSLLLFCQIFLWLKKLLVWLLLILSLPIRLICFVCSCILRFYRSFIGLLVSFSGFNNINNDGVFEEVINTLELSQIANTNNSCPLINSMTEVHEFSVLEFKFRRFEDANIAKKEDSVLDVNESKEEPNLEHQRNEDSSMEDLSSTLSSSSTSSSSTDQDEEDIMIEYYMPSVCISNSPDHEDVDMNVNLASVVCSSNEQAMGRGVNHEEAGDDDQFYNKYTERMRWFDLLNCDRSCGISAILNKQLGTPSSFETIDQPVDFSNIPYMPWSNVTRKRLLRSLESDLELVYVAQSCLSWEALNHQYQKVKAFASKGSGDGVFYNNIAGKFQKFQILLERFMEDEMCEGKRFWNYVQGRFSQTSLLQVPEVSGYMEEEKEGMNGEAMRAIEVLKTIEKCIEAFWLYVKTDDKKPWWKVKISSWKYSPVEDPRDLRLFADLTKTFQKKELWMKDLQGKKGCWWKRISNTLGENQKEEMLFAMIEMKLVSRVLKMSIISSSQLKWCQEKLHNIEFTDGKVVRARTSPLFPSS